ncbi:MAG: PLD nuclease N-terminal domain-containing protein [Nanoarchaeota archaeon]
MYQKRNNWLAVLTLYLRGCDKQFYFREISRLLNPRKKVMIYTQIWLLPIILILSMSILVFATPASCIDKDGREVSCGYREGDFPVTNEANTFWYGFGFLGVFLSIVIIIIVAIIFWIWMLVDCIKRDFKDKALWIIIILLTGVLGCIIYYFVVKKPYEKTKLSKRKKKRKSK